MNCNIYLLDTQWWNIFKTLGFNIIIIIIIIWFGDTDHRVAPYRIWYKLKSASYVSLTNYTYPFLQGSFHLTQYVLKNNVFFKPKDFKIKDVMNLSYQNIVNINIKTLVKFSSTSEW